MFYQVEIHREINTLISHISVQIPTEQELQDYMAEIVRLGNGFAEEGSTRLYHLFLIEPRRFDFAGGLRIILSFRNNKDLIEMRKRLNTMTILVGQTPKVFQTIMSMLPHAAMGGRPMAIFPTLEAALDFVKTDYAYQEVHSHSEESASTTGRMD